MRLFNPILMLGFAVLAVFCEATISGPRHWLGAQVDVLPAIMVYAALNADVATVALLAVLGGVCFDSFSANPLGVSILPLFAVGFPISLWRDVILRGLSFAQVVLGAAASGLVPSLVLLLLLHVRHHPVIGWGTLWQLVVLTVGGAAATPVVFALFDWCGRTLGYKHNIDIGFRPDREIRHGKILK